MDTKELKLQAEIMSLVMEKAKGNPGAITLLGEYCILNYDGSISSLETILKYIESLTETGSVLYQTLNQTLNNDNK